MTTVRAEGGCGIVDEQMRASKEREVDGVRGNDVAHARTTTTSGRESEIREAKEKRVRKEVSG